MINKLYKNLINSVNGLKIAVHEHSFFVEIILGIIIIPYALIVEISIELKLLIFIVYFILLAFELINTSIEKLCDKITKNYDEDIKITKDIASASVFIILLALLFLLIYSMFS